MPYGVHFKSEAESPVEFWLWRIATALQDASEFADEAGNIAGDVETGRFATPRQKAFARALDGHAQQADSAVGHGRTLLEEAQALASGKPTDDPEVIARLKEIFATVAHDESMAEGNADSNFDSTF